VTPQRWRIALWLAMFAIVAWLGLRAGSALIPFAVGALLAFMLTPVVDTVTRVLPEAPFRAIAHTPHQTTVFRRGIAVLLVYAVIGYGLLAGGTVVVPLAIDQTVEFVDELPQLADEAREQVADWSIRYREQVPENVQEQIDGYAADLSRSVADSVSAIARNFITSLTGTLGLVFGFLIVPIWMFYALRDRHIAGNNLMTAVPDPIKADVDNVITIGDRILLRYIRGQLLLGVIVGVAVGVGLTFMDIRLSLALGVIAGITELIPIIGPWLGAVPGLLIVAATDPDKILWVGALYLAVQIAENNFLVPRIQGQAVDLHPAMVIMLLVLAGAAFGFIGLLVIMPLTAILRELFWYADRRFDGVSAEAAFETTHAVVHGHQRQRPLLFRIIAQRSLRPRNVPADDVEADADAEPS
jgi:predicted PurR-regulated permease PerM